MKENGTLPKRSMLKEWLLERARLYGKCADNISARLDNISIKLDYPDRGWIDTHIILNGEETELFEISWCNDPFEDIRLWLEYIVQHIFDYTPSGVNIDCESYSVILNYEPLPFLTDELLTPNPPELCGLFYIYDDCKGKYVTNALCETKAFVTTIYQTLLSFAEKTRENDSFVKDWIEQAYNSEWGEMEHDDPKVKDILYNKVHSEIVERFINDEYGARRFVPVK